MESIKDMAKNYILKTTANIADLEVVFTNMPIMKKTYNKDDGSVFEINVITIGEVDFRVPSSVLIGLRDTLKVRPNLHSFRVLKSGSGKEGTKYTVIALEDKI